MTGILVVASLLLVLACFDISSCISFYRETNRGAPALPEGVRDRARRLSPDQVALRHAFLFLIQKANYYWQLITAVALLLRLYLRPKRTVDRDIALLLINTSLVTWVSTSPLGARAV